MRTPSPLIIDIDKFNLACIDDDESQPYVDLRIDTIPLRDDDPDYSETPDLLRKAAAWLVKAAEWLERRQQAAV